MQEERAWLHVVKSDTGNRERHRLGMIVAMLGEVSVAD